MTFKHKLAGIVLTLSLLVGTGGAFATQSPEYDRITDEMVMLRELELLQPLDIRVQSRAELQEWLLELLETYPEAEQAVDERVFVIFGFVEPDTDLGDLEIGILGEQIAGYYNAETKEMVVIANGSETLSANNQLTFAHETVHALQDQHFDLLAIQRDTDAMSDDEMLAIDALIEGDATLGEVFYLLEYPELLDAALEELEDVDSPALDSAPRYYSETLFFPYEQGALFVSEIYGQGGWEAVNAMYQDPPVSTEQILHYEKYLTDEQPLDVSLEDPTSALGEDWEVLDENVMGEFRTDVFLRNGGARTRDARDASEGWGGDEYVVVGNDNETAFVWTTRWDTDDDADEFFNLMVGTESRRLDAEVERLDDESHIRLTGENYVGEIVLNNDTVTYTLAETSGTLDAMTN